jgi:hypothetical protein
MFIDGGNPIYVDTPVKKYNDISHEIAGRPQLGIVKSSLSFGNRRGPLYIRYPVLPLIMLISVRRQTRY